jgi:hypothetical protein
MNTARDIAVDHPIDPPAIDPLAIYLNEMNEMRHTIKQLQAEVFRLIGASVARSKKDEMIIAAQRAAGVDEFLISVPAESDAAKIERLQGTNTVLGKLAVTVGLLKGRATLPEWLSVREAAYRFGRSDERMRQLVDEGKLISRRDGGGPISILRASVDALLVILRREPRV